MKLIVINNSISRNKLSNVPSWILAEIKSTARTNQLAHTKKVEWRGEYIFKILLRKKKEKLGEEVVLYVDVSLLVPLLP